MQHLQPFLTVQIFCQSAHCLKVVQGIQHDTGKPCPCCLDILCLDGEDQELCFTMPLLPCSNWLRSYPYKGSVPRRTYPPGLRSQYACGNPPCSPSGTQGTVPCRSKRHGRYTYRRELQRWRSGRPAGRAGNLHPQTRCTGSRSYRPACRAVRVHLPEG